jgi:hypothetical protein
MLKKEIEKKRLKSTDVTPLKSVTLVMSLELTL